MTASEAAAQAQEWRRMGYQVVVKGYLATHPKKRAKACKMRRAKRRLLMAH